MKAEKTLEEIKQENEVLRAKNEAMSEILRIHKEVKKQVYENEL